MRSSPRIQTFVKAGDPTGRLHKAGKTDHAVEAGFVQEPRTTQVNRTTDCSNPPTTAADGPVAAKIPPWNPIERYRSDKNSFPDYGRPRGATMGNGLKNFGQSFLFGNFLGGRPSQPEAHVTTPKRVNDSALENPPKRLCIDDDAGYDILSTPSSSGLPGESVAASSAQRKGAREAPSLRSSADRSANGIGLEEYRSTQHRANSTAPYKSRKPLVSLQKPSDDPIQDDEEDIEEIDGPIARKSVTNGRSNANASTANASFTTAAFTVACGSDDELSADQPLQANARSQNKTGSMSQVPNGRKRRVEIEVDEGPQILRSAKRRTQRPDRADMHRTTFASEAARIRLRVAKAVCEPSYVYLAGEGINGVSNEDCVLVPGKKGDLPFEAVDAVSREPIANLSWLTPKTSKVTRISHAPNSMRVKVSKSNETTTAGNTGAALYLQFGNDHEAKQFVSAFDSVSGINVRRTMEIDALNREMDRKFDEVVKFNEQKTGRFSDADVQFLEHEESKTNRDNVKSGGRSPGLAMLHSQQAANKKPIRSQMRADNSASAEGNPKPKTFTHGATSMTPEQVRQLQENFGDDSQSDGQSRRSLLNVKTPSRVGISQPELRSQRSLRSAGPKPQSPSPAAERWTDKHPDWADDWKTDLVYERTVVSKSDVERLDEGQLLNDEIITFYLKYLHKQLEERDAQLAKRVYFFNSFFWEKLKPKRGTVNYDGVKNWTAKVDLFSFDYIIVPINEHMHWYVAIICNAKELLSSHDTSSETDEYDLDKPHDPAEGVREDEVPGKTANDTIKKIAIDVSHISIEDDPAEDPPKHREEDMRTAAAKKTKAQRKGTTRKYDPKATRVIALDSLGGTHSPVSTALKIYLQHEIEAKKGLRVEVPATIGMSARDIPNQPNFTDCGVYLLGYMREFMKDPDKFATNILQREERTWNFNAPTLRNEIRDLIFKLQKDYQQVQDKQRRERARAKRQKPKSQGPATASGSPSRSSDEPAGRESPAPPPSSAEISRQATPRATETSLPQAHIDEHPRPADQEPRLPPPSAGDTAVNSNNISMIVNVDESIEDAKAPRPSTTAISKPVESIELDNDDAPEPSAATRTPSARHMTQCASAKTATLGTAFDEGIFLAQLPSSPSQRSPVKAGSHSRGVNREDPDGVKTSGSRTGSVYTRKHGATKGRVTKAEVIPSSSEEEAGGKEAKRKKKSPTIDLTSE